MTDAPKLLLAVAGLALLGIVGLLAFRKLDDKPHPDDPHVVWVSELLEDADVQEMLAKRKGREGR